MIWKILCEPTWFLNIKFFNWQIYWKEENMLKKHKLCCSLKCRFSGILKNKFSEDLKKYMFEWKILNRKYLLSSPFPAEWKNTFSHRFAIIFPLQFISLVVFIDSNQIWEISETLILFPVLRIPKISCPVQVWIVFVRKASR